MCVAARGCAPIARDIMYELAVMRIAPRSSFSCIRRRGAVGYRL